MSDVADADAGTGTDAGGGADTGGGAQPEWMAALPDDLKSDATLARYPDLPTLAKSTLELRRQASSRVIVPGEDADTSTWNGFFDQIGRPKAASGYDITVPEGDDGKFAGAFRDAAHMMGLLPWQAKGLADWHDQQMSAQVTAFETSSREELATFKSQTPDYDAKLASAKELVKSLGIDGATADQLDVKLGTTNLMKLFFGLAERVGEHKRVDGEAAAIGVPSNPSAALDARMTDAAWRDRVKVAGSPERAEYDRLVAAARNQS